MAVLPKVVHGGGAARVPRRPAFCASRLLAECVSNVRRLLADDYFSTVKPCSSPYLTEASCQAFRPSASLVEET